MKASILIRVACAAGLALGGCAQPARPAHLVVMAAASLQCGFEGMAKTFESAHAGVTVEINLAGSQQLAQQLAQGAPADVFASANEAQMRAAVEAGRVEKGAARLFARNRLVVVVPQDNPGEVNRLSDLARPGLKLALAAKEVPAGQYALEMLARAAALPAYGADFPEWVLANAVSYEANVRSVLTKVALGEVDAGIVYASDTSGTPGSEVLGIEIPDEVNVDAYYAIAVVADSPQPDLARQFVELVVSEQGQKLLGECGLERGG